MPAARGHRVPVPAIALVALVWLVASGCGDDNPGDSGGGDTTAAVFELSDFQSASTCAGCHPNHYDEWSGSMHAYATQDPIWAALNRHEIEDLGQQSETFCIQCHSPIGFLTGTAKGVVETAGLPDIVREGVTCDACHTMVDPGLDNHGVSTYELNPGVTKYGPISDPERNTAHLSEGREFFRNSDQCRNCHNLFIDGEPFEPLWTEWIGAFSAMARECQDCHMPAYTGQAAVGGPTRTVHRHEFIGVDLALTDFPNRARQRAAVDSLMKTAARLDSLRVVEIAGGDSLAVRFRVQCLTGHNLPAGTSFRRDAWLHVLVESAGATIFESGYRTGEGDLDLSDPQLERFYVEFEGRTENGRITWNNSLEPLEVRHYEYVFPAPGGDDALSVRASFLFRALQPSFVRELGHPEFATDEFLPIFTIDEATLAFRLP